MSKELVISANRHETRVAIIEDDQVVEVYHQRENEYSLAGSIHKGRVTRVLPGMQSAFVDIGLDRDAFLYVSDFFEDNEEYDKIVTSVEEKVLKLDRMPPAARREPAPPPRTPRASKQRPRPRVAGPDAVRVPGASHLRRRRRRSGHRIASADDDRDRRGRRSRRRRGGRRAAEGCRIPSSIRPASGMAAGSPAGVRTECESSRDWMRMPRAISWCCPANPWPSTARSGAKRRGTQPP